MSRTTQNFSFVFALLAALGSGCGGSVQTEGVQDSGTDGATPLDGAAEVGRSDGPGQCLAIGASCSSATDCCSGACDHATCTSGASCIADGQSCTTAAQCCAGTCNGVCGQVATVDGGDAEAGGGDAGGCSISGTTACDQCLMTSCCSQVAACEKDSTICTEYLDCIVKCEKGGSNAGACSATSCQGYSDTAVTNLQTCGSNLCVSPCSSS